MIQICGGLALAYRYCTWMFTQEKQSPRVQPSIYPIMYEGMLIIPLNNTTAVHIHHWMVYSVVLMACMVEIMFNLEEQYYLYQPLNPYWSCVFCGIGWSIGMVYHGLHYSDCFQVLESNPWTQPRASMSHTLMVLSHDPEIYRFRQPHLNRHAV